MQPSSGGIQPRPEHANLSQREIPGREIHFWCCRIQSASQFPCILGFLLEPGPVLPLKFLHHDHIFR